MSWLVSSITNSLKAAADASNDDTDDDDHTNTADIGPTAAANLDPNLASPRRGVKDDLSELSKTLTRQFWGVASFLAPPPPDAVHRTPDDVDDDEIEADAAGIGGIRSDLVEIGGRVRTGIAKLSSNRAVEELTKMASSLMRIGEEEEGEERGWLEGKGEDVVGVTDDVVAFARDVALHPETWLDFPLPDDEDDVEEDFELSDAQQAHALAVEHLAPRLAALRIELCPGYMSEGSFWKIYFVLVHPRLSKEDALLLSTPQIMEARAMLTQGYHNRAKSRPNNSTSGFASVTATDSRDEERLSAPPEDKAETVPIELSAAGSVTSAVPGNFDVDKHQVSSTEIPIIDKAVVEEGPINKSSNNFAVASSSKGANQMYEDEGDDWLKEDTADIVCASGTTIPISNDEDVSFSDLEDDDDVPSGYKGVTNADAAKKESRDWVALNNKKPANSGKDIKINRSGKDGDLVYEDKEISGWLDFDEIDST
ncbi:hypothetical protein AKJ16_DCAP08612 [Drosera capensis]